MEFNGNHDGQRARWAAPNVRGAGKGGAGPWLGILSAGTGRAGAEG